MHKTTIIIGLFQQHPRFLPSFSDRALSSSGSDQASKAVLICEIASPQAAYAHSPSSPFTIARRTFLIIYPLLVFGKSGTKIQPTSLASSPQSVLTFLRICRWAYFFSSSFSLYGLASSISFSSAGQPRKTTNAIGT